MDNELLSTRQAAELMGVPAHLVRKWGQLGLICDQGGGGKGNYSRWLRSEVLTAPGRRRNLRVGPLGRALTNAERLANRKLDDGEVPGPPRSLPYRTLAYSCGKCGKLLSPKYIHKAQPRTIQHHACGNAYVRERRLRDESFRNRLDERSRLAYERKQRRSLETSTRKGYAWTGPEIDIAMRADLTYEQAALMLGRTVAGVMYVRRGVGGDPRKYALWGDRPAILSPDGQRRAELLSQAATEESNSTPGEPEQRRDAAA